MTDVVRALAVARGLSINSRAGRSLARREYRRAVFRNSGRPATPIGIGTSRSRNVDTQSDRELRLCALPAIHSRRCGSCAALHVSVAKKALMNRSGA
jgi:hypothetical protein